MLPRHLLTCPYSLVSCQRGVVRSEDSTIERCNQIIRLCDAAAHDTICEYRSFSCSKGCGSVIVAKYSHLHSCSTSKQPDTSAPSIYQQQQHQQQQQETQLQIQKKRSREKAPEAPTISENVSIYNEKYSIFTHDDGIIYLLSDIIFFTRWVISNGHWEHLGREMQSFCHPQELQCHLIIKKYL